MKTVLNVNGMSCSHCERAVQQAVGDLAGVKSVAVDLNAKTVTVEHEEGLGVNSIEEAIIEEGFEIA